MRAEIAHFVPQLHPPTSRYLLALIYIPGSLATNEDHFDNTTSRIVIEPILGRNYYTVEFMDLSIPVNAWVDLYRVKLECKNADSWMVRDYMERVSRLIAFKQEHGRPVDLFVAAPDAKVALKVMLRGFAQVGSLLVFVRTNPLGHLCTVTVAEYHPSYGIMSRKPKVQVSIRDQFCLYEAVCTVGNVARSCCQPILTEKAIMAELSEEHHRRLQLRKENIIVLAEFLQGNQDRIQEVMDHSPSINYNGVIWAIATVTHLEEKSGGSVTIAEKTMLVTQWIWEEEHYIHAMEYVKVKSVKEYLTGVAACLSFKGFRTSLQSYGESWKAQWSLLQTVGALENAGYSPSVFQGNGESWSRWYRRRIIYPVSVEG